MEGSDIPVVVVTRHPDYADEINVYGTEIKVIYLDLGSSFSGTPEDATQAQEWAESEWDALRDLPATHPARDEVATVISTAVERYFTTVRDGNRLELHPVE
jgi:hypothetical protein